MRVRVFREFFREIDANWEPEADQKINLRIIGSTALMLQANYERGTKDSDVLKARDLSDETTEQLLKLAGKGTEIHNRHRLYVDLVSNSIPFLPQKPNWITLPDLGSELTHFEISVLSVVDVVVSKLKRFSANDIEDIEAMVDQERVPHGDLIERFELAVDLFFGDARAENLPRYLENLNRVERDMLLVPESDIELPDWAS